MTKFMCRGSARIDEGVEDANAEDARIGRPARLHRDERLVDDDVGFGHVGRAHFRGRQRDLPERAILRLSLVLRHDPTYAPVVLEILHLRREPSAAMVRGDAQRLLGRHMEAEAAFDAAAESLGS